MRSSADFRRTTRSGARAGRSSVVVHLFRPSAASPGADATGATAGSRVGFVVSKAVGNAVVRNRVKRRLRHLSAELIEQTPSGTLVVVRALPAAATTDDLAGELRQAWQHAVDKLLRRDRPRVADGRSQRRKDPVRS